MLATCCRTCAGSGSGSGSGSGVVVVVMVVVVELGVVVGVCSAGVAHPASIPTETINPANLFIGFLVCRTNPILANTMVTIVAMNTAQTMLIAYDGSDRAVRAMEYAARYLQTSTVEILTAWEPVARQAARVVTRTGLQQAAMETEAVENDPAYEEALAICREGVKVAEDLGLAGRAHLVESATTIASAIVDAADELDVDIIVTGTRALKGFRGWWNNSTAEHIVRHAGRPVFIVPPEKDDEDEDDPEYFE